MYRKLNNKEWEEYINKYDDCSEKISVRKFCIENNISKSQYYYHKNKLEKLKSTTVFHSFELNEERNDCNENLNILFEVKIKIGDVNIAIPSSETLLIVSIIKELTKQC